MDLENKNQVHRIDNSVITFKPFEKADAHVIAHFSVNKNDYKIEYAGTGGYKSYENGREVPYDALDYIRETAETDFMELAAEELADVYFATLQDVYLETFGY